MIKCLTRTNISAIMSLTSKMERREIEQMKFKDYAISIVVSVVTCAVVTTLLRLAVASL